MPSQPRRRWPKRPVASRPTRGACVMTWLVFIVLPAAALAAFPGVSRSRRVLAGALVLLVPVAGPLLAFMVRRSRGGGIAMEPVRVEPTRRMSPADVRSLG